MARKFGTFVSFNEKWEKDLSSLMRKDMSMVSPVVVRHKVWDVNDLTIISRNAWAQKDIYFKLVEEERVKMKECLLLRVADTPEVEIAKSMQFESDENYNKWLVSHELDVNPSRFPSPVDGWQAACMYFGYKPDIRLLESAPPEELLHSFTNQVRVLVSPDDGLKDDKSLQVTGEFRHSEDFRNVVTPLGEEFLLSGGQAEVIRLLHEGAERKTPWLSDAFLIEEVFQEVKEKKLKKLFGNESAWRALTERGNKKSLLRLKDWNVPDSDKTNSEKFAAHKEFSVYQ
jgi:hypothetical protein